MYLNHLSVSGFRGVGYPLDMPLGHRTIIYGPNGSGKSSILQAIAWAVYGKLPLFTGGVFTREDALVNDFLADGSATVSLVFSNDIVISRVRDKQGSTTRGTNPLTVSIGAEDPQATVDNLIGLSLEEFYAAVFLHQETIRDFITTTPEKRSAAIDHMLGTHLLRTLVKAVDPAIPSKAIVGAQRTLEYLDVQLSQASVLSREVIWQHKQEHGDPAELPHLLEAIRQNLAPIAEGLGLSPPGASLADLEDYVEAVRQAQLRLSRDLEGRAGRLDTMRERYEQVSKEVIEDVSIPDELDQSRTNLQDGIEALRQDEMNLARQLDQRRATEQEIQELVGQVGELPVLQDEIEETKRNLEGIRADTERTTLYNQILTAGHEYLEQASPDHCPLCKQQIADLASLLTLLYEETPQDIDKMRREFKAVELSLVEMQDRATRLEQKKQRVGELKEVLIHIPEDIEAQIERGHGEQEQLNSRLTEVQAEISRIEGRIEVAADRRSQLEGVLTEIEKVLGYSPGEDIAGSLSQEAQALREQVTEVQAIDIQPIAKELERARQLRDIQKDEHRLDDLESEYQTANRQRIRLSYHIQRLTELRNGLQDIAETTKTHQAAIVMEVLNNLDIDEYYQQLSPHPAYRELQIEPELTKKGTYHYWIKALTDDRSHGTYVQTRFSTAQANCAAVAIFLAVNQHLSSKLETIILDDPTQSMDPEHKMRLAETLAAYPRQVIVATENPETFELLARALDKPTVHELGPWSVAGTSLAN